ncbi:hypothetical protein [Alkanindiges illinoisensis]|uniref:hypothetical protein n=1 Tax=Alkanindiges illinoisensis TaxID=197183 RepID=UPI00047BCFD2|nr:hypothetical protein [Alkanindiges illinoisensis]
MLHHKNYAGCLVLAASSLLISACGGSSSTNDHNEIKIPETKPQSFQSSFNSTLTIEEKTTNGSKKYDIPSKSTNQKDNVLAYSVITELANSLATETEHAATRHPRLNQLMRFALDENGNTFNLDIEYNPLLKKVTFFSLTKNTIDSDNPQQTFSCRQEDSQYDDQCSGSTVQYDPATGSVDINFTQTILKSNNSLDNLLILNGKLKGRLSIAPQTVQDIPQTSRGSVIIDGKTHQVIAAVNTPEQIIGSRIFNQGISVLTDNDINMSFSKDDHGLYSQYIDFLHAEPADTQNLSFKDLQSASQFTLLPTLYNFSSFGNEPKPASLMISASVEALKPQQVLTLRPISSNSPAADQNNPWYSSNSIFNRSNTPNDFTVRLINHNTVAIESQDITATIKDKKVKSVQLNTVLLDSSASSLTRLIVLDYQCGEANSPCKGIQVEPNGFGVKFNNTVLTNSSPSNQGSDNPPPPAITLNGGLDYTGR